MKKILLFIPILMLTNTVMPQNFNKESDNLIGLSQNRENYIFIDFLKQFDYTQEIGLGAPASDLVTYKLEQKIDKNGNIVLKKHPFFSSISYHISNGIVKSIRLNILSDKVNSVKEYFVSMYGIPDRMTCGHLGKAIFFVPNKYLITLKDENGMLSSLDRYLDITAVDFMDNVLKYDEFSKIGMVYFDSTPIYRVDDATYNQMFFGYSFSKSDNHKEYILKNEFIGKDWLFIKKIDFLIDDNEVLTIDIEPNREVSKFITVSCKERSINMISPEFIEKILMAETIKVKVSGEGNYIKFNLAPLHKYQILTAKYYYENDLTPAGE